MENFEQSIETVRPFICKYQLTTILQNCRGEERQFFIDKINSLAELISKMPQTHESETGDKANAYLHYFRGSMDFYITERDMEDDQVQAYGWADLGPGGELCYISIVELVENHIELDLFFEPKPLSELKLK